jgi:probable DNA metabolism protein
MVYYDGSLEGLFALLGRCLMLKADEEPSVSKLSPAGDPQGELFGLETVRGGNAGGAEGKLRRDAGSGRPAVKFDRRGRNRSLIDLWEGRFPAAEPSPAGLFPAAPPADGCGLSTAAEFFELAAGAYCRFIACWMSGLPVETELIRFARKVMAAAEGKGKTGEARAAADRICRDRSDPAVERVLAVSARVYREICRLTGLLRFTPAEQNHAPGLYAARCAPDYFILPALAEHFRLRFGAVSWLIVDEKRSVALVCNGERAELVSFGAASELSGKKAGAPPTPAFPFSACGDVSGVWEELWRNYHHSINNEARKNPRLQRRFMPFRYWKYLPECNE